MLNDIKYYYIVNGNNTIFFNINKNIINNDFIFLDFDADYIKSVLSIVKNRMILLSDLWNKFPYFFARPYF